MRVIISNSCSIPIYEQIKNQIINQIMTDELSEGDSIPSIRALASDIKISVMTIKKACLKDSKKYIWIAECRRRTLITLLKGK